MFFSFLYHRAAAMLAQYAPYITYKNAIKHTLTSFLQYSAWLPGYKCVILCAVNQGKQNHVVTHNAYNFSPWANLCMIHISFYHGLTWFISIKWFIIINHWGGIRASHMNSQPCPQVYVYSYMYIHVCTCSLYNFFSIPIHTNQAWHDTVDVLINNDKN